MRDGSLDHLILPVKTPKGIFVLEGGPRGLKAVHFPSKYVSKPKIYSGRVAFAAAIFRRYFANPKTRLNHLKLDWSGYTAFERSVYETLRRIPAGETISYGALARKAGFPGAARAVGSAMRKNRMPIVIPCHRVVRCDGSLGEYSAGVHWKRWLLEYERMSDE